MLQYYFWRLINCKVSCLDDESILFLILIIIEGTRQWSI